MTTILSHWSHVVSSSKVVWGLSRPDLASDFYLCLFPMMCPLGLSEQPLLRGYAKQVKCRPLGGSAVTARAALCLEERFSLACPAWVQV